MASTSCTELLPGNAVFYGVRPGWVHLWEQAKLEKRNWYYIDNSYFDASRETFFRVTRNALQCDGLNACCGGDGESRLAALGVILKPWRTEGKHIVICPQSDEFLATAGGFGEGWLSKVTMELRSHTDRPFVVRLKNEKHPTLADDLDWAWALVTHMSCAAVEALMAGVPVFCTGRCSAQWLGTSDLSLIETPIYPERLEWARLLAANQWSLEEMRSGECWKALNGKA